MSTAFDDFEIAFVTGCTDYLANLLKFTNTSRKKKGTARHRAARSAPLRLSKLAQWRVIQGELFVHHRFGRPSFSPIPISASKLMAATGFSQPTIWRRFAEFFPGGWDAYSSGEIGELPPGISDGNGNVDAFVEARLPDLE